MWKESLVARFHNRSSSIKAQGAPLIASKSRPFSTATLDTVVEHDRPLSTVTLDPVQEHDEPSASEIAPSTSQPAMTTANPDPPSSTEKVPSPSPSPSPSPPPPPVLVAPEIPAGSKERLDIESHHGSRMRSIRSFLMEELDTTQAAAPLTAYCFMTGFIDAVSFSAVFVWCAFQTGNSVQLAIALARLFNGQHDYTFRIADRQALCSVLSFIIGAFTARIGDKLGCKTRLWMTLGTFIQTLFTMAGALAIWQSHSGSVASSRGEPAWTDAASYVALAFISASMGLQGIMGKRLNTQFTTTVVLTTTWCELMTEPQLFNFRRLVVSRDHKVMAILFLFVGGFTGAALLNKIGDAGTLGIGTGLRFVLSLWWLLVPAKGAKS